MSLACPETRHGAITEHRHLPINSTAVLMIDETLPLEGANSKSSQYIEGEIGRPELRVQSFECFDQELAFGSVLGPAHETE
jgi:hypothetical protein